MTPPPMPNNHPKKKRNKKSKPKSNPPKEPRLSAPDPKRIDKLRELKLFERNYTQELASKSLDVSVSTIKRDEEIIRNQDQKWSYNMAKGGFMAYVRQWFNDEVEEINHLREDIKKIRTETTSRIEQSVNLILQYNENLPSKEKAFIHATLFEFQLQSLTSSHAGTITLIDNTIANLTRHCEDLIKKYPLLSTIENYQHYLEIINNEH